MNASPTPRRRDRGRLIGCGVLLVLLLVVLLLTAYGLGLWGGGHPPLGPTRTP